MEEVATPSEIIQNCLNIKTDVNKLDKKFTSRKYWKITNPSEKINLENLKAVIDTLGKTAITLTPTGLLIIQNTNNKRKRTDVTDTVSKKTYEVLPKHYDHVENEIARNILLEFINQNNYVCKLTVCVQSGHTLVIEPSESIQFKHILKVNSSIDTSAAWEFSWNPSIKIRIKFL